ncbi:MAG: hypothetical protein HUU28_09325 [Planctomycetaceae bacterium]|nr:hypothetical protein [Planctomycetaceae bacterium]
MRIVRGSPSDERGAIFAPAKSEAVRSSKRRRRARTGEPACVAKIEASPLPVEEESAVECDKPETPADEVRDAEPAPTSDSLTIAEAAPSAGAQPLAEVAGTANGVPPVAEPPSAPPEAEPASPPTAPSSVPPWLRPTPPVPPVPPARPPQPPGAPPLPPGFKASAKSVKLPPKVPESSKQKKEREQREKLEQRRREVEAARPQLAANLTPELAQMLSEQLGVRVESLRAVGAGYATADDMARLHAGFPGERPETAVSFPEFDSARRLSTLTFRGVDVATKGVVAESSRGLTIPDTFGTPNDKPLLLVEGATDVMAAHTVGICAIGRSSALAGTELLAKLLASFNAPFIVMGENDANLVGQRGMRKLVAALANDRNATCQCALPPELPPKANGKDRKDLRDWIEFERTKRGVSLSDVDGLLKIGQDIANSLIARAERVEPRVQKQRLVINWSPDNVAAETDRVEQLFLEKAPNVFYQQQGRLVRISRHEGAASIATTSADDRHVQIAPVDADYLLDRLSRLAVFYEADADGIPSPIAPPRTVLNALLARGGELNFPILRALVESPLLLPDGKTIEKPGYDPKYHVWYEPRGTAFPPIPRSPSKDDAVAALDMLDELLENCVFESAVDRSSALAMLLSAAGRPLYGSGPAFGVTSPARASGKSTLTALGSLLTTGREPVRISPGSSEEESDKRIFALLQGGCRHICFDNLTDGRWLDVPAIAKAITESEFTGRVLGKSETRTASTTGVQWTFAGVGLYTQGDIVTRSLLMRLDMREERTTAHDWGRTHPRELLANRRGDYLVGTLTVLRAFQQAGFPSQGLPRCRFQEWSERIRSVLPWLDRPDPYANALKAEYEDPEADELRELLGAWIEAFGERAVLVADVIQIAALGGSRLRFAILGVTGGGDGPLNARALGKYLARHADRIESGLMIVREGESGTRTKWAVRAHRPAEVDSQFPQFPQLVSPTRTGPGASERFADVLARERERVHADERERAHERVTCEKGAGNCENCANCESTPSQGPRTGGAIPDEAQFVAEPEVAAAAEIPPLEPGELVL